MANTARSRKAKGRRFQQEIRDRLLSEYKHILEDDDIKSTQMGGSGVDIQLSPAARKIIPYSIECKNQEKMNIWSSLEQCEDNCVENTTPVLFFKKNNSKTYAVLPVEHFIQLISSASAIDKQP